MPATERFKGEIVSQGEITTNRKGGSLTATLRKQFASFLGADDQGTSSSARLSAASIMLDPQHGVLLLTPAGEHAGKYCVRRTGEHSLEIFLDNDDEHEIDEVTAAFIELKKKLFAQSALNLSQPFSANEWEAMTEREFAKAEERRAKT